MSVDLDEVEPGTVLVYDQGVSTSSALLLEVDDEEITFAGSVYESGFEPPENIHTESQDLHDPDRTLDVSEDQERDSFGFTYEEYEAGEVA